MQQYKVPKYLGGGVKIFGPFTFKQFFSMAMLGGGLILLYYIIPHWLFFILIVFLLGGFVSLFFIKIDRVPIVQVVGHLFTYLFSTKLYIWKKKEIISPIKIIKKPEEKGDKKIALKIAPKSQIKRLMSKIEIGK